MGEAPKLAPSANAVMVRIQPVGYHHIIFCNWAFYAELQTSTKKIRLSAHFWAKMSYFMLFLGAPGHQFWGAVGHYIMADVYFGSRNAAALH